MSLFVEHPFFVNRQGCQTFWLCPSSHPTGPTPPASPLLSMLAGFKIISDTLSMFLKIQMTFLSSQEQVIRILQNSFKYHENFYL